MSHYKQIVQAVLLQRIKAACGLVTTIRQIGPNSVRYGNRNINQFGAKELQILEELYVHWKDYFPLTFQDFVFYILEIHEPSLGYFRPKLKSSGYRRRPAHQPKELSEKEITQREWRKNKKRNDPRSKKNQFDYSDYYRESNNRSLRRWVKARLKAEDYDLEKGWRGWKHYDTDWEW